MKKKKKDRRWDRQKAIRVLYVYIQQHQTILSGLRKLQSFLSESEDICKGEQE